MEDKLKKHIRALSHMLLSFFLVLVVLFVGLIYLMKNPQVLQTKDAALEDIVEVEQAIENGIHVSSGFVDDAGMVATIQNCTGCHSAQLVTQNRMSREGWEATIRWMQETQNLWDLGNNEEIILSYLSKNYAPETKGRRQNLEDIEWYNLD